MSTATAQLPKPLSAHIGDQAVENIPLDMRVMPCWVAWRWEFRDGKWTKPPIDPFTGTSKDATGPDMWMTFDKARDLARLHGDGVGFALGRTDNPTGFVPPDIDHCVDEMGNIDPRALELVERFDSYAERTPTNGIRIWIRGKKPGTQCKAPGHSDKFLAKIELYEHSRYLTVTGRKIKNAPAAVANRQAELDALYAAMFPLKAIHKGNGQPRVCSLVDVSDEALLDVARKSKGGDIFTALFDHGDATPWGGNESSADQSLANRLAFWTGCDPDRMERLFSMSELGKREKWTGRPDYRGRTIEKAIKDCTAVYQPKTSRQLNPGASPSPNGTARPAQCQRPQIVITTKEHEVVDLAVQAIGAETNLFQRGGNLVSILEECKPKSKRLDIARPAGSLRISLSPGAQIRRLLTLHADWCKVRTERSGAEVLVSAHPPAWAVEGVATLGNWPGIRPLEGIVEAPTLRPDGTILDTPGYDVGTGLWFAPSGVFPTIPSSPTKADAEHAVDALLAIVEDFPFAGLAHAAVWLASCLTALGRFAIDGPCPLFLFDANCPGTGKSKLCDITAILATGRDMARGAYPDDQEEMQKMLLSVALAGDRFVLFDNVPSGFSVGGSAIDRALTARTMKGRILGRSEMTPELPVNAVFFATGNNLGVRGDALRRIVPCRLETTEERPEERTGFKISGDLLCHVKERRGPLVAAALTILRAYVVAGRPDQSLTPMDFPAWCSLIRNAVYWAMRVDPCETRKELVASDEETTERKVVIDGWEALCTAKNQSALTAAEAREGVDQFTLPGAAIVGLREVFMSWSRDGKLPSAKSIGKRIAKYRDRNCGGKCLKRTTSDPVSWYVHAI